MNQSFATLFLNKPSQLMYLPHIDPREDCKTGIVNFTFEGASFHATEEFVIGERLLV